MVSPLAQATEEGEGVNLHTAVIDLLRHSPQGLTLDEIEGSLARHYRTVPPSVVECLLRLSDQVTAQGACWFRKGSSKEDVVVDALRLYARESGRRLFKAEAALSVLAPEHQPTREELARIVLEAGEFELLKNQMIRRKE